MSHKHFEDVWNESEEVSAKLAQVGQAVDIYDALIESILAIKKCPDGHERKAEAFGKALFLMCDVARRCDINSFTALKDATEEIKATFLDPNIE